MSLNAKALYNTNFVYKPQYMITHSYAKIVQYQGL